MSYHMKPSPSLATDPRNNQANKGYPKCPRWKTFSSCQGCPINTQRAAHTPEPGVRRTCDPTPAPASEQHRAQQDTSKWIPHHTAHFHKVNVNHHLKGSSSTKCSSSAATMKSGNIEGVREKKKNRKKSLLITYSAAWLHRAKLFFKILRPPTSITHGLEPEENIWTGVSA